jgi:transforming growth factor-beta-induced protein
MPTHLTIASRTALALVAAMLSTSATAQSLRLDFQDGIGAWSTVLDGVMGGLSTGKVSQPKPGILRFTGELSLENNGGFSQMRTAVREGSCTGADGFVLDVKGDGRSYTFDVRVSNVRMMAGSFQQKFDTIAGEWKQIRLPLDGFKLFSFGREMRGAAALDAAKVESIGVTLADKQAGPFALEVRSIATYSGADQAAAPAASGSGRDLATVAGSAGLKKLLACVGAAGLELPAGPVTILAPTDAAFDALPKGTVDTLLRPENKSKLRTILLQHVIEGRFGSAEVLNQRGLVTLAGQQLAVDFSTQQIGGASLVATDVAFDGGVVHVIDKVLLPENRSIAEIAVATESLKTLVAAVKAAGLVEQLGPDNGPWTVFAPVDSAFAKLPKATLTDLLKPQNRAALTSVLGLHVVPGRIAARELLQKQKLTTLMGAPIEIRLVGGKLNVGGAGLVATDVQAQNGVIHLIDTVITAPAGGGDAGRDGRATTVAAAESVNITAELRAIYELAVDRGVPLFNRGEVEGCAAVYEVAVQSVLRLARGRVAPELLTELKNDADIAAAITDGKARAWAYRRAMDRAYETAEKAIAARAGNGRLQPRR